MIKLILLLPLFSILSCNPKLENWITYSDHFNIGSISLPKMPQENLDTTTTPNFKLVSSLNLSSIDNKKNSPSTFSYDLYFPTNIQEFDLYEMKKDSNIVNKLFDNMIRGAQRKSNTQIKEKNYFNYPEPGAKFILVNDETKNIGVVRIIIFDNYIISTNATGTEANFSYEIENEFFSTLKIKSEGRNRK